MDKNTKFKCEKCKKIFNYIEIEANLDLGVQTEKKLMAVDFPYVHKDCGGIIFQLNTANEKIY